MRLQVEEIYTVQRAVWGKFNSCIFGGKGWSEWKRFLEDNLMEKEFGFLDFQLHEGGRVSILDPSEYARLWMSEDLALKILALGGLP